MLTRVSFTQNLWFNNMEDILLQKIWLQDIFFLAFKILLIYLIIPFILENLSISFHWDSEGKS